MRELVITEYAEDVTDAAADLIYEAQTQAIAARGVYRIALSGGKTPAALYAQLGSEEWKGVMAWDDWEVFWGDERAVPPDHADSNYRVARETLLSRVPIVDVWRMRGESGSLREAAEDYARTLKARFGPGIPVFDTILLGMGADGHTASLFPGHSALESQALVEWIEGRAPAHPAPPDLHAPRDQRRAAGDLHGHRRRESRPRPRRAGTERPPLSPRPHRPRRRHLLVAPRRSRRQPT